MRHEHKKNIDHGGNYLIQFYGEKYEQYANI